MRRMKFSLRFAVPRVVHGVLLCGVLTSVSAPVWAAGSSKYWLRLEDLRLAKPKPAPETPSAEPSEDKAPSQATVPAPTEPPKAQTSTEATVLAGGVHRFNTPRQPDAALGEMRLKVRGSWSDVNVLADGRLRWNGSYAHASPWGEDARRAYEQSADWRELYMAAPVSGSWRATLGYQQLNWGRADNLRVLDQVNPLDLRDYVLPDMEDYRIALPMLRLQGPVGSTEWSADTYWAPQFKPHRLAVAGSEFDLKETASLAAQGVEVLPSKSSHKLRDGEQGLHLSRSLGPVDISLVAMRIWDRLPVYRLQSNATGTGMQAQTEYHRQTLWGAGAAWATAQGWVWRSELAHVPNATFNTSRTANALRTGSMTTGLLGVDRLWRDWLFTAQASDRVIGGWQATDVLPRRQPVFTLAATGNSMNGKLESRVSCAWMTSNGDGTLCQTRLTYRPTDTLFWAMGTDSFIGGAESGFFGRFDKQDRLWLQVGRHL